MWGVISFCGYNFSRSFLVAVSRETFFTSFVTDSVSKQLLLGVLRSNVVSKIPTPIIAIMMRYKKLFTFLRCNMPSLFFLFRFCHQLNLFSQIASRNCFFLLQYMQLFQCKNGKKINNQCFFRVTVHHKLFIIFFWLNVFFVSSLLVYDFC